VDLTEESNKMFLVSGHPAVPSSATSLESAVVQDLPLILNHNTSTCQHDCVIVPPSCFEPRPQSYSCPPIG
jgi:hypothetical protein